MGVWWVEYGGLVKCDEVEVVGGEYGEGGEDYKERGMSISRELIKKIWPLWDSNPRPLRDWSLNPTP